MSLMERVSAMEDMTAQGQGQGLGKGIGRSSGQGRDESKPERLDGLRQELLGRMTSDQIAAAMADNPLRAKNEIRSVCTRIFEGDLWKRVASDERQKLVDELIDSVFGLGPLEALLADETVTEIMVNGPRSVFFERGGVIYPCNQSFASDDQVRALIDRIIGPLGRRIDEASPMVNARLRQGHRVHAVIPPLSLDGPVLTIRKFRDRLYTLDELVSLGSLDAQTATFLRWAVRARKNIAVSGGTGSGKTTLLNALSCEIPPAERIITIEDSAELKFSNHPHVVRLEARPRNAEGLGEVTIRDLVTNALRMRPDRIIVGECRGGEALDMLQAMNTGHDGSLTTLHANSSADALMRLTTMVYYAADLPVAVIEAQIASAIEIVVQLERSGSGKRRVCEIASFSSPEGADYSELQAGGSLVGGAGAPGVGQRGKPRIVKHYVVAEDAGIWLSVPEWVWGLVAKGVVRAEEVEEWASGLSLSA